MSLPAAPSSLAHDQRRRRALWLRRVAGAGRPWLLSAAGALVLDAAAAIGFAACLAAGLAAVPGGIGAAWPWLVAGVLAATLRGGCGWAATWLGAHGSATARTVLRRRVLVAALGSPLPARQLIGETMSLAVDGVEATDGYLARFVPARLAAAPAAALVLVAVAIASPVGAAILAATLVPFVALMMLAGGAAADQARQQFGAMSRLAGLFTDRVRGLPIVLAFQTEAREADRLASAATTLRQHTMRVLRIAFVSSAGLDFFAALAVALLAVYVGFSLLGMLPIPAPEHLDLAQAIFVLALAPEFYAPFRRLAATYHDKQAAEAAADRLLGRTEARPPLPGCPAIPAPPRIRFCAATVHYPGEDRPALDSLEAEIGPGEILVLLGPSGSGKTTAISLLLGLAPLSGGEVWIDDLALSQLGSIAPATSWVGQSSVTIAGSIADNVCLSRRNASRAEIEAASARVGLCAALRNRPDGLDTRLNDRGSGLSGGERRRMALARALLKPAPVLLLDEPTAHLDAATERRLIRTIRLAARGRTTIIATHSEALAAIGDRVIRLPAP